MADNSAAEEEGSDAPNSNFLETPRTQSHPLTKIMVPPTPIIAKPGQYEGFRQTGG